MPSSNVRILLCGDVEGNLLTFRKHVEAVNNKIGPFQFVLSVGKFFGSPPATTTSPTELWSRVSIPGLEDVLGPPDLQQFIVGDSNFSVPVYFTDSAESSLGLAMCTRYPEGLEICPNLHFLGDVGVAILGGIRVAFLGRLSDVHSTFGASPQKTPARSIRTACKRLIEIAGSVPGYKTEFDLLCTPRWPSNFDSTLPADEKARVKGLIQNNDSADTRLEPSREAAQAAVLLEPRFIVCSGSEAFYQRAPYRTLRAGHVCRMIGLGCLRNSAASAQQKHLKPFHALLLTPCNSMSREQLSPGKNADSVTACPFEDSSSGYKLVSGGSPTSSPGSPADPKRQKMINNQSEEENFAHPTNNISSGTTPIHPSQAGGGASPSRRQSPPSSPRSSLTSVPYQAIHEALKPFHSHKPLAEGFAKSRNGDLSSPIRSPAQSPVDATEQPTHDKASPHPAAASPSRPIPRARNSPIHGASALDSPLPQLRASAESRPQLPEDIHRYSSPRVSGTADCKSNTNVMAAGEARTPPPPPRSGSPPAQLQGTPGNGAGPGSPYGSPSAQSCAATTTTVLVSNMPYQIDEDSLHNIMSTFGQISSLNMPKGPNGAGKGLAWVRYETRAAAEKAVEADQKMESGTRRLRVNFSTRSQETRTWLPRPLAPLQIKFDIRPHTECWFCLSNPNVEKRLVVNVGDHVYTALAKGGLVRQHVLILPIPHCPSLAMANPETIAEVQRYSDTLRLCFEDMEKDTVIFERYMPLKASKMMHTQLQVIPIPRASVHSVKDAFLAAAKRAGCPFISLGFTNANGGLNVIKSHFTNPSAAYLYLELPTGFSPNADGPSYEAFIHVTQPSGKISVNFGREVLAQILGTPQRANWQNCVATEEDELSMATELRRALDPFNTVTLPREKQSLGTRNALSSLLSWRPGNVRDVNTPNRTNLLQLLKNDER